jgi:hypothetical protein
MKTSGKVLLFVIIPLLGTGAIYLAGKVLNIQNQERDRLNQVRNALEQTEQQLATQSATLRVKTVELQTLQHQWGKVWNDQVNASPNANTGSVSVDVGQRVGLAAGDILYAFAQGSPLFLGSFVVEAENLGQNSAVLSFFPVPDTSHSIGQAQFEHRMQLLRDAGRQAWEIHNELPPAWLQQLETSQRRYYEQLAATESIEADQVAWEQIQESSNVDVDIRNQEFQNLLETLPVTEREQREEEQELNRVRNELSATQEQLAETVVENKQLADHIREMEEKLVGASALKQQTAVLSK